MRPMRGGKSRSREHEPGVVSLPRALSKLGFCSRSQAESLIRAGQVQVNNRVVTNPAQRVHLTHDRLKVDGEEVAASSSVYVMLNKPRGLVTTSSDEKGRDTVYRCFEGSSLPRIVPVGRLDQASEGLLLFTNDTAWANQVASPERRLPKTYHVQVSPRPSTMQIENCLAGVRTANEETLKCSSLSLLREGERNAWLEVVLHEGKNRHIRRMLAALNIEVLRLIRISIGPLKLGNLPKGEYRLLSQAELEGMREFR